MVNALQLIDGLINLSALAQYRTIHQAEHSAVGILKLITAFYVELIKQNPHLMETNSVLLRSKEIIEDDDMFSREGDAGILAAAQRYIDVQNKTSELLAEAKDRLFSGSPGTVYLKKLGHRPLTPSDFENVVNAHGTPQDQQAVIDFGKAQLDLRDRLKTTKIIGVILEQAGITKDLFYNRVKQPNLWKPDEVIKIMTVLDRLQV